MYFNHEFLLAKVSFSKMLYKQGLICYFKELPWLAIETGGSNLSKYRKIFLYKCHTIACQKCDEGLSRTRNRRC